MARVYGIKKRLEDKNTDQKIIKEIIGNGDLVNIINQMEKLLDPENMHQILDSCACGGGKEYQEKCKKTGKEISEKTLIEKVDHVNKISPDWDKIFLNSDNTLKVIWSPLNDNGKHKCFCSATIKKGVRVFELALENSDSVMPLSYCFCCAGSGRRHLQLQLGVELKTKEIVSSPINSRGRKPCEIIFEIIS